MRLIEGRLDYREWWELPSVYLFTGNSTVKLDGGIVMGRGAAKQVRDQYPGIDVRFGDLLKKDPGKHLLWVDVNPQDLMPNDQWLGWFKVKNHWMLMAEPAIIAQAAEELYVMADEHEEYRFHMNFPGIGNGGLKFKDVLSIVKFLPDNVLLYKEEP